MLSGAWLPIGFSLPDGTRTRKVLFEDARWQIFETAGEGRALVVQKDLAHRWITSGLVETGALVGLQFSDLELAVISSGPTQAICPVFQSAGPHTVSDALSFAVALRETRALDRDVPIQDAIFVEKFSRLLPTYSITSRADDATVLGYWLTGGANVSASSFRRLHQMISWMSPDNLRSVLAAAGLGNETRADANTKADSAAAHRTHEGEVGERPRHAGRSSFELAGRPDLENFFNEHVIDVVQNKERYKALGIGFPSAMILHGPPGCGKTFAVERLIEFLGWPSYEIDASSVASPYIHETSRKVAEVFEKAMSNSPSVVVIDEMEAFLADRDSGTGHHRVEEVAEFLRRIPEATKNEVLVIAMTNRVDMIDTAILRRGRFDHLIKVDFASVVEIKALLEELLSSIPTETDVDAAAIAGQLAGRPLSDVAFVVREAARRAARSGKDRLDQRSLLDSIASAPARERDGGSARRIGFV